jgi:hypothetical protein
MKLPNSMFANLLCRNAPSNIPGRYTAPSSWRHGTGACRTRLALAAAPPLRWPTLISQPGDGAMRIHNLYADANGQSHFRDIEVEWAEEGRAGK